MDISSENAERIWNELIHEKASVWYVSDQFGFKIMVKAKSDMIRSIIKGCKIFFLFGIDKESEKHIFHTGLRIYDDEIHFANLSGVQRFREELLAIKRIMKNERIHIEFYDELCTCVASANLSLIPSNRLEVIKLLGNINDLYVGNFTKELYHSLNCFDYTLDNSRKYPDVSKIETLSIEGKLDAWHFTDQRFVGVNDNSRVKLKEGKEGEILEKQVWFAFDSLFNKDIYLRPQIANKNGFRELTDILSFSEYGIFLIETKALSVFASGDERNMARKVAGVQKQVEKGINQLAGAARKIKSNQEILSSKGETITFDRTLLPHCIVLVSELLPFADWTPIVMKMFQTMVDQSIQLHVMDLTEFMQYIGHSKGSKYVFDYLLMERSKQLVEHQTIHLQLLKKSEFE